MAVFAGKRSSVSQTRRRNNPPTNKDHSIPNSGESSSSGSRTHVPGKDKASLHQLDPNDEQSLSPETSKSDSASRSSLVRVMTCISLCGLMVAISLSFVWLKAAEVLESLEDSDLPLEGHADPLKTKLPAHTHLAEEKFLLMDYSPWLGFNNMRYMMERGLYLADMLNRTLVLPNHLRIRSCSDASVCARTAIALDLEAIGRNPQESELALDLGYFFDLEHLSQSTLGQVIDFQSYMEDVIGVPKGSAMVDHQFGAQVSYWKGMMDKHRQSGNHALKDMEKYIAMDEDDALDNHQDQQSNTDESYGLARIHRARWDMKENPKESFINNLIRNGLVDDFQDSLAPEDQTNEDGSFTVRKTFYAFGDVRGGGLDKIVQWSLNFRYMPQDDHFQRGSDRKGLYRRRAMLDQTCQPPVQDSSVESIPWEARFPAFATCKIENYVGLRQTLGPILAKTLSVEGQFHTAGWISLIYSNLENAHRYRSMAMSSLRYSPAVHNAAEYLLARLYSMLRSQNNQADAPKPARVAEWLPLSMHVRRGDFVQDKYGWQKYDNEWMKTLVKDAVDSVYLRKDEHPQHRQGFYMATDESNPAILDYFQSIGAILFEDLLDDTFEERYGHLIVYDDWIGLVEQLICAQAEKFYGTMTSSFTSGIVNMRFVHFGFDDNPDHFEYFIQADGPILSSDS